MRAVSLYEQAGKWLRRSFAGEVSEAEDESAYYVARGRIGVRVQVTPVGDEDVVLEAYSWVAQGLHVTPEVGLYLAERNAELRFGALEVDGEGAIILGHTLFADGAGEVVLVRLVEVLAETAEALDGELRRRFPRVR